MKLLDRLRKQCAEEAGPPVQLDFTAPSIHQSNNPPIQLLTPREQFLVCVFYGALAWDLANDTADAQLIARHATQIPEGKIGPNPVNSAKIFLNYCHRGTTTPSKWM